MTAFPPIDPSMIEEPSPELLVLPVRRAATPLTPEEREQVLPQLRERLSANPFYAKRIAEEGDKYLHDYMDGMPVHRQGLPDPLLEHMKARGIPLTRKNYLELDYPDGVPNSLPAELEQALPQELEQ